MMEDPEFIRKISELCNLPVTEWKSTTSRVDELKQIKNNIQRITKDQKYIQLKRIIKALNHPVRVNILVAIGKGVLCPCELEYITGLTQATISHHLTILEDADLILKERQGKWTLLKSSENPVLASLFPF